MFFNRYFIIITLFTIIFISSCSKNNIEVYNGPNTSKEKLFNNWVVINYWADWCAPCIKEIPALVEFSKENPDIFVYTFNYDQLPLEELEPLLKIFGVEVPSLISYPGEIWGIQKPSTLPATYIINKNGEVVLSNFKPQDTEGFKNLLLSVQ